MLRSERLLYRPPVRGDAQQIFDVYANDQAVTRYLSWPRHISLEQTHAFIDFSEEEWSRWQTGPLLIESVSDGSLLGSTGLALETPFRASTGYCLAQSAWGRGYATEALQRMQALAAEMGLWRLEALVHQAHDVSAHVLKKCGFEQEAYMAKHTVFPNLTAAEPQDVLLFAQVLKA